MKDIPNYKDFVNESRVNEDSKVEDRIKELAEDPKNQKAMGSSNVKDLEYAFMALFKRGYGAAKTNWGAVHPSIKAIGKGPAAFNTWGHARLNAFIKKSKAYSTSDKDAADWLKGKGEKPTMTNESMTSPNKIVCDGCGWDWKPQDGGDDLYTCHKCGLDNTPKLKEARVNRKHYDDDPPDIGLYSKGGRDAIKGTGYANKEKAEFTIKELDKLMKKGERTWAMSIATTMESRAKKHRHQTDGMRDSMKIFRSWIDKNKKTK